MWILAEKSDVFGTCHFSRRCFCRPSKSRSSLEMGKTNFGTEIRSFLGLAGYYRRFIEGFSLIATPLTQLTRKNKKWVWSEECEKSFQELKRRLTTALVLTLPSGTKGFMVYSDASGKGLGCVLMQHGKVIAYASRQLKTHEVMFGCRIHGSPVTRVRWLFLNP